jgi:PAS domain S-box-containing protein
MATDLRRNDCGSAVEHLFRAFEEGSMADVTFNEARTELDRDNSGDAGSSAAATPATLHDHVPVAIVLSDAGDGGIVSANDEAVRLFGWSREELVGRTSLELRLLSAPDRAAAVAQLRAHGVVRDHHTTVTPRSGRSVPVTMNVDLLEVHGREFLLTTVTDVNERDRMRAALDHIRAQEREHAETLRLLLETASQGIASIRPDGTIIDANPALEAMLGWPRHGLVGQPRSTVLPADVRAAHDAHLDGYSRSPAVRPMGVGVHLTAARRDGTLLPVEISLNHVETATGRVTFAFVTDISVRRRAEDALAKHAEDMQDRAAQLQRLASELTRAEQHAREQLARRLHDDLQQLLFSSRLKLDRLAAGAARNDPVDPRLVSEARERLDEAIQAARDLAKDLFGPMWHDAGLPAALHWLADHAEATYGLRVDLRCGDTANPSGRDVRTLALESVKELLFNVTKHAGTDAVSIEVDADADDISLVVEDHGSGFVADDVFRPSRNGGTGLGLFSIRERLALFGGRMEVDSVPGRGSRFTIVVPRAERPVSRLQ